MKAPYFTRRDEIDVEDLGFLKAWSLFAPESGVGFSFRYIEVAPETQTPVVVHEHSREVVMVLGGEGYFQVGGEERRCREGDFIHVPPGTPHSLRTEEVAVRFVAVEDPPVYQGGDFRIIEAD